MSHVILTPNILICEERKKYASLARNTISQNGCPLFYHRSLYIAKAIKFVTFSLPNITHIKTI